MTDLDAPERYSVRPIRPVPRDVDTLRENERSRRRALALFVLGIVVGVAIALTVHGCAGAPYSLHEPPKGNTPSSRCTTLAASAQAMLDEALAFMGVTGSIAFARGEFVLHGMCAP